MIRKKRISEYSYIRASDVHREIMYYEVLDKDDNLLMTISPDPEGHYDVYFEKLRGGRVIRLDLLKEILAKMEPPLRRAAPGQPGRSLYVFVCVW